MVWCPGDCSSESDCLKSCWNFSRIRGMGRLKGQPRDSFWPGFCPQLAVEVMNLAQISELLAPSKWPWGSPKRSRKILAQNPWEYLWWVWFWWVLVLGSKYSMLEIVSLCLPNVIEFLGWEWPQMARSWCLAWVRWPSQRRRKEYGLRKAFQSSCSTQQTAFCSSKCMLVSSKAL